MRKVFWAILLLGAYIWALTSGNDKILLEKGKAIYKTVVIWFDDADIDYHLKNEKNKRKSRRWE